MEMLPYELRYIIYEFEGRSVVSEIDTNNKKNNLKEFKRILEWSMLGILNNNSELISSHILKFNNKKMISKTEMQKIDKVYTEEFETFVHTWTINLGESTPEIKTKLNSDSLYLKTVSDSGLMLDPEVGAVECLISANLAFVSAALTPNSPGQGLCTFELRDKDYSFAYPLELILVSV